MPNNDEDVTRIAVSSRCGCVIAAAGCGKTEQIALATKKSDCKRLILTHTHAGVDAILNRLQKLNVPTSKFHISTIAGWCLQFCRSYPKRSGFDNTVPLPQINWDVVYEACSRLMLSGAVDGIIHASYGGVFVDEYQDCTVKQHDVIRLLAEELPCFVFGDPLQGIFDFGGQEPVDWKTNVYPVFPLEAELTSPHRWIKAHNPKLAEWLNYVRTELEKQNPVDLSTRPSCVIYAPLPQAIEDKRKIIQNICICAWKNPQDEKIIVLDNAAVQESRALLARNLSNKWYFRNIEPLDCKALADIAKRIDTSTGIDRLIALIEFVSECKTGTNSTAIINAVKSHLQGGKQGRKTFQDIFPYTDHVVNSGSRESMLDLLCAIDERTKTTVYRPEMFSAMKAAMRLNPDNPNMTLADRVWEVQNCIRHFGRRFGRSSVGSILLVKGLEFDHSVIVHQPTMTNKDWYVALTRATKSIRILAPSESLVPFKRPDQYQSRQQSFNFD
jgi:DNA helicase-2/ATP-dependent DNA helicase PcrA